MTPAGRSLRAWRGDVLRDPATVAGLISRTDCPGSGRTVTDVLELGDILGALVTATPELFNETDLERVPAPSQAPHADCRDSARREVPTGFDGSAGQGFIAATGRKSWGNVNAPDANPVDASALAGGHPILDRSDLPGPTGSKPLMGSGSSNRVHIATRRC